MAFCSRLKISKRIIDLVLFITATTISILPVVVAIDNHHHHHHHHAFASNIVQKSAPPELLNDAVIYAKDMIATCTPKVTGTD
jgi:hypothetical protein